MPQTSKPYFSVLVSFRNREIERVKFFLESLVLQSYKDFELVLVDYGSEPNVSNKLRSLIDDYHFCKYVFANTRGNFWNKAGALNLALGYARSDIIVIADIDLLYAPDFFQVLRSYNLDKVYLKYRCYYLSENTESLDTLIVKKNLSTENMRFSDFKATGLIVSKKNHITYYDGYDTFYRYWGGEDRDMLLQLENQGLQGVLFDNPGCPVFHQWHPNISHDLPKGWTEVYNAYLKSKEEAFKNNQEISFHHKTAIKENRSALKIFDTQSFNSEKEFKFSFPLSIVSIRFIVNINIGTWLGQKKLMKF